ncbi:MAG: NUDIX domain-containing protein [Phycisphaeraceae bacterium]|nr:NUDIX domain-containing protein [Phycisphaerales bacterium]MCB9861356.1 NUDIX domain-containing protein [Phycisphaeraceae bacterium]
MSIPVPPSEPNSLPYKIACLCDLRDEQGRVLMLKRLKHPNFGLCSPIGGKLDTHTGESPAQCAVREIAEEAEIDVPIDRIRLIGMVSERAYEGKTHWLMFVYRVLGSVSVKTGMTREGELFWVEPSQIESLDLPESDRKVIWPLVREVAPDALTDEPGFFAVHIDCDGDEMTWNVEQLTKPANTHAN